MKKTPAIYLTSAVLATAFAIPWAASGASGTTRNFNPSQNPSAQPAEQEKSQEPNDLKTFTGTIAKSNGNFVLHESTVGGTYGLDDQKTASNYEGKKVVVTGTCDSDSKIIHVQKIEELA